MSLPPWTSLATFLLLLEYASFSIVVAAARRRTGIHAPQMTGAPELDRAIRVHLNTNEKLLYVLPLTWLAAFTVGDVPAAVAAGGWGATRIVYAVGYLRSARGRQTGAILGDVFEAALGVEVLVGIVGLFRS